MKKIILMTTILVSLPMLSMAQDDDMYFVPTKESKAKELKSYGMPGRLRGRMTLRNTVSVLAPRSRAASKSE